MANSIDNGAKNTIRDAFGNVCQTASQRSEQWHAKLVEQAKTLKHSNLLREEKLQPMAERVSAIVKRIEKLLK